MSRKRGGFVTIRHNDWPHLTAKLLNNVCNDVEIEPKLLPVTEIFLNRTANTPNKARLDITSREFWVRGQQAFTIWGHLTQTLKYTLTRLFHNVIHKMKKRKTGSTTRFYKMSTQCFYKISTWFVHWNLNRSYLWLYFMTNFICCIFEYWNE